MANSVKVATAALIASTYSVVTVILGPLGYSWLQVRIAEALTPLPFLMGFSAVAGLTVGCIVANIFSPVGIPDMIFGPLLTLFAALLSWKYNFHRMSIACVYPIIINAIGVSAYIYSFYNVPYTMSVGSIAVGEFIAVALIGYPLMRMIAKSKRFIRFFTTT